MGSSRPHPLVRRAGDATRPLYVAEALIDEDYATELLMHELAHMWFGDNVTLRQWNDIFTNEAYASWAQWEVVERRGGTTADDRAEPHLRADQGRARLLAGDHDRPGPARLFDTVYTRGPMALQALRNVMGDHAFVELVRDWAQDAGTRSLEEWMVTAQARTSVDLTPFFRRGCSIPTHRRRPGERLRQLRRAQQGRGQLRSRRGVTGASPDVTTCRPTTRCPPAGTSTAQAVPVQVTRPACDLAGHPPGVDHRPHRGICVAERPTGPSRARPQRHLGDVATGPRGGRSATAR